MRSQATYFGANGWLLEIADCRVLVDPWLSGPLVFPPGAWMLRGELPHPWPVPINLDLSYSRRGSRVIATNPAWNCFHATSRWWALQLPERW